MPSRRRSQRVVALTIVVLLAMAIAGLVIGGSGRQDRAYELEQRLRCPVCQSVSIAESPSQTAEAMRVAVAQQVAAGRTDQQIIDYFRARYGDWVLLDPPASGATLPLWLLPLIAAAVGVMVLFRPRRRPEPAGELTAQQRGRVSHLVERVRGDEDSP